SFCEEDYAVSFYIAEFINSLTNLTYVYFALRYMYTTTTTASQKKTNSLLPKQYDFMSLSLLSVGTNSFVYHVTLRQTLQYADDFSMLLLAWSLLHATLTVRQSSVTTQAISVCLATIIPLFAAFYVQSGGKVIYHVLAFTAMLLLVGIRSLYLFHFASSPQFASSSKRKDWNRRMWKAAAVCVAGYALWQVDLHFCAELRRLREDLGLPWAWGLELHGWWHVLTAIGASGFMDVAREVRDEDEEKVVVGEGG
ncbi:ceramidase, partial [Apodospora peruviana]